MKKLKIGLALLFAAMAFSSCGGEEAGLLHLLFFEPFSGIHCQKII
ncbi:MAG: hypothetical protein LBC27_02035 [Spirochaetaceae bacterium]|nr:hypothetical protein [Spirochaetaceae bacterium]